MNFSSYKSGSKLWNMTDEEREQEKQKEEQAKQQENKASKVQEMFNKMPSPSSVSSSNVTPINNFKIENLPSPSTYVAPKKENLIELNQPLQIDNKIGKGLEKQPFASSLTPSIENFKVKKEEVKPSIPDVKKETKKTILQSVGEGLVNYATDPLGIKKVSDLFLKVSDLPRNALASIQETSKSNQYRPGQTKDTGKAFIEGLTGKKQTSFMEAGLGAKRAKEFEKQSPIISGVGNVLGEGLTDPTNIVGGEAATALLKGTKLGGKLLSSSVGKKLLPELSKEVVSKVSPTQLEKLAIQKPITYSEKIRNIKETLQDPNIVKNTLENTDITTTKPLSRQEFNKKYKLDAGLTGLTAEQSNTLARDAVNTLQQDIGKRIINRLGTDNLQDIASFYKNKYGLPNINVIEGKVKGDKVTSNIRPSRDLTGYDIIIDNNKLSNVEHKAGVLRHEIEHAVDMFGNYEPQKVARKNIPVTDINQLYTQGSQGHHKNYDWFEADYLFNRTNKDLGDLGENVPNITSNIPEINNIVPNSTNNIIEKEITNRASELLGDLGNTVKGERFAIKNPDGTIKEFAGTKRFTSDTIARIKDSTGATYKDIEDSLIRIRDNKSTKALDRKIKDYINFDLQDGYKNIEGARIEPNKLYNLENEINTKGLDNVKNDIYNKIDQNLEEVRKLKQSSNFDKDLFDQLNQERLDLIGNLNDERLFDSNLYDNISKKESEINNISTKKIKDEVNNSFDVFNEKPVKIEKQQKERGFSKNIRSDENMDIDIRKSFDENPLFYEPIKNSDTLKQAQDRFSKGFDAAYNSLISNTKTLDQSDVPLAKLLADDAAKRGDIQTARNIMSAMAEKLTETGRFSQAASILRKSDPVVFENYINKSIAKVNEQGRKLYKDKWKDLQIGNDIVDEIYNMQYLDETARDNVMKNIHDKLSAELPSSNLEKFNAWRRMAMLLNPTTHIRNFVGNFLVVPLRKSADTLAAGLEKVFVKEGQRTKGVLWSNDKNRVNIVNNDWVNVAKPDIDKVGKYANESFGGLMQDKATFKNKKLEGLNKFSMNALEMGDNIFMARAYKDALGGYLQANKLDAVTDAAREYAKRRALEATYKQNNLFATYMQKAKQSNKFANVMLEAIMPYTKTPSNILLSSIDYSPLGLFKAVGQKIGKSDASSVIETLSKSVVGSSVAGLGFFLGTMGLGRASENENIKLENLKKEKGSQAYSINTPFGSYTFDWAQPFSVPLAMGMEIANAIKDKSNVAEAVWKGLASGGDTLFNMSMLKSIKDTFGGQGSTSEKLMKAPINYMTQAYPSMFGKISKISDDTLRNTYGKTTLENTVNQLKSKVPVLSQTLPEKRDMFGDVEKTGNIAQRSLQNIASPGLSKSKNETNLTKELTLLAKNTGKSSHIPRILTSVDAKELGINAKEMSRFQQVMGETARKEMEFLMGTKAYQNSSDLAKVSRLSNIVKESYDTALEDLTGEAKTKTKEQKAAAKKQAKEVSKMTEQLKIYRKNK